MEPRLRLILRKALVHRLNVCQHYVVVDCLQLLIERVNYGVRVIVRTYEQRHGFGWLLDKPEINSGTDNITHFLKDRGSLHVPDYANDSQPGLGAFRGSEFDRMPDRILIREIMVDQSLID